MKLADMGRRGRTTERHLSEVAARGHGSNTDAVPPGERHAQVIAVQSVGISVGVFLLPGLTRARKRVERTAAAVVDVLLRSRHRASTGRFAASVRAAPQIRALRVARAGGNGLRWATIGLNVAIVVADFFFVSGVLADLQDQSVWFSAATLSAVGIALFTPFAVIVLARDVGRAVGRAWAASAAATDRPVRVDTDDRWGGPRPGSRAAAGLFGWIRLVHPRAFVGAILLAVPSIALAWVAAWRFGQESVGIGAVQAPWLVFVVLFAALPLIAVFAHAAAWDEDADHERSILRQARVGGLHTRRDDRKTLRAMRQHEAAWNRLHDRLEKVLRRMELPQETVARLLLEQRVYSEQVVAPTLSVVPYGVEQPDEKVGDLWGGVLDARPALDLADVTLPWLDRRVRAALRVLHEKKPVPGRRGIEDTVLAVHAWSHVHYAEAQEIERAASAGAARFQTRSVAADDDHPESGKLRPA